jgi:hypothetical protein
MRPDNNENTARPLRPPTGAAEISQKMGQKAATRPSHKEHHQKMRDAHTIHTQHAHLYTPRAIDGAVEKSGECVI